ncbi:YjbQ family protein [Collinsella sp. AGMB00827]|uniref:YjbQ family protein n=1 Tax=Collinsella ureilytica TaxID=2869515 RepID=A0ABS7MK54_9ACTN|nr:YjbQ family protein [Collinsella urealyticum]MBY4797756.1 YjbQ family protein [Collinsella urealyticum]
MAVYKDVISMETEAGKPTYVDITDEVAEVVAASGVQEGIVTVISCHTTCAVFSEEFDHDHTPSGDTFLQADLSEGLNRIFPEQHDWNTYRYPGVQHFEEVESWPDPESWLPNLDRTMLWNGDAHLRSTLIGSSQTFEVADGKLEMNGLASIFFVDFDRTRPRTRRAKVCVIGE